MNCKQVLDQIVMRLHSYAELDTLAEGGMVIEDGKHHGETIDPADYEVDGQIMMARDLLELLEELED
jgi:hypothetical protein